MSASGYITLSGTQAPWSSPRLPCWCTRSVSGNIDVTSAASAEASGVGYVIA